MSLALKAVLKAEEQLPKVIPPAAHGLIDTIARAPFSWAWRWPAAGATAGLPGRRY